MKCVVLLIAMLMALANASEERTGKAGGKSPYAAGRHAEFGNVDKHYFPHNDYDHQNENTKPNSEITSGYHGISHANNIHKDNTYKRHEHNEESHDRNKYEIHGSQENHFHREEQDNNYDHQEHEDSYKSSFEGANGESYDHEHKEYDDIVNTYGESNQHGHGEYHDISNTDGESKHDGHEEYDEITNINGEDNQHGHGENYDISNMDGQSNHHEYEGYYDKIQKYQESSHSETHIPSVIVSNHGDKMDHHKYEHDTYNIHNFYPSIKNEGNSDEYKNSRSIENIENGQTTQSQNIKEETSIINKNEQNNKTIIDYKQKTVTNDNLGEGKQGIEYPTVTQDTNSQSHSEISIATEAHHHIERRALNTTSSSEKSYNSTTDTSSDKPHQINVAGQSEYSLKYHENARKYDSTSHTSTQESTSKNDQSEIEKIKGGHHLEDDSEECKEETFYDTDDEFDD